MSWRKWMLDVVNNPHEHALQIYLVALALLVVGMAAVEVVK